MYYALIESHLRYADVIWGSLSETKIAAFQCLQDRAYSIITNARIKDSWSASWLNVENHFRYYRNVMIYKIMNRSCPENLLGKCQLRYKYYRVNTATGSKKTIPPSSRCWTTCKKSKPVHVG